MELEFFREILESGSDTERLVLELAKQSILLSREKGTAILPEFIGIQGRWTGERSYRFETDITPLLYNINGVVHGGVIGYIADTAMGTLIYRLLPDDKISVTSEIKINYISPAREGKLVTLAELLHLGKRTAVAECKMYNNEGDLVAVSTASFVILDKRK